MRFPRRWRPEPQTKSQTQSHLVIRLLGAGEDETVARYDLPAVIEADDDGQYPLVQAVTEIVERPMEINGIEVTMRHGPTTSANMRRLIDSTPSEPR